jgi:hypothetical protein
MRSAGLCVLLAGCNAILGNRDFTGPDGPDAPMTCEARGLPPTTLSGTVFAPNQTLPIHHALVYVPTAPLADIPDGPNGPTCASGAPAASAFSDTHGHFTLSGVSAGSNVPLVIQVGKWRRQVTLPSVAECADTAVDAALTHLPRNRSEGHIPHIAITTGIDDTLECLARDLGIAEAEITSGASSTGRVRLYAGNGAARFDAGEPFEPLLSLTTAAGLAQYDAVLLGCEGRATDATVAGAHAMFDFTNLGGWLWVTHNEFTWLQRAPAPWSTIGSFTASSVFGAAATTAQVDLGSPQGPAFAEWSVAAGASTTAGALPVQLPQQGCKSVDASIAHRLLFLDAAHANDVQIFTWDAAMGGRLVFSDVHLTGGIKINPLPYPTGCAAASLPQAKAIMFQLFDAPTCLP